MYQYDASSGPSYQISEEVKERVEFKEHNLLKDTYPTDYIPLDQIRNDLLIKQPPLIHITIEFRHIDRQVIHEFFEHVLDIDAVISSESAEEDTEA